MVRHRGEREREIVGSRQCSDMGLFQSMCGMERRTYIDESLPQDSHMRSRCAFGCGGSVDLGRMQLAGRSVCKRASHLKVVRAEQTPSSLHE